MDIRKFSLKNHIFELLLAAIVGILFATNYTPHTYLTGWDNLQTDLNPWLGVKRAVFSVWQEYQSFGLVAGMAHAADLVRATFIWLLSFLLPQSLLRYAFHFIMVLSGVFGSFHLFKKFIHTRSAFLGSLFYLLNIGTIQILFLPFEAFTIFFGVLPWAIASYYELRVNNLKFILLNLLITPAFVAQQLFVVYAILLAIITLTHIRFSTQRILSLAKRATISAVLIFLINSFWIVPQIYFLKTSGHVVQASKANQIATEDIYFSNVEKGTLRDFSHMEGFFYERTGISHQPLFASWKNYRSNRAIEVLLMGMVGMVLLGLLYRSQFQLASIGILGLCMIALLHQVFPFNTINAFIRDHESINQIFRSPFTKFIIPYSLVASYLFAAGTQVLYSRILTPFMRKFGPQGYFSKPYKQYAGVAASELDIEKIARYIFGAVIALTIFVSALPAFMGNFISKEMRVPIPADYLETMEYFKTVDPSKRIALLPEYTFWGWYFNKWGYNGSGFLWYGIEQPIISRTFDVWSLESENYFWEVKSALETEDTDRLLAVFDKYNVDYVILDRSLIPITAATKALQYDRIEHMLNDTIFADRVTPLGKGEHLQVYEISRDGGADAGEVSNFITKASGVLNSGPSANGANFDYAYQALGIYKTDYQEGLNAYFPFMGITSQTVPYQPLWTLSEAPESFIVNATLPAGMPTLREDHEYELELYKDNKLETYKGAYHVTSTDASITAEVEKTLIEKVQVTEKSFEIPYLDQNYGYLIKVAAKHQSRVRPSSGVLAQPRRPFVSIVDLTKEQAFIEARMLRDTELFVLPSERYEYGLGYQVLIQDAEPGTVTIEVYAFPTGELQKLSFGLDQNTQKSQPASIQSQKHSYYKYSVDALGLNHDETLILYQSFHPGWKAYLQDGFSFTELRHVKINNWANGWELTPETKINPDKNQKIVILFWPQYLQFAGFALMVVVIASTIISLMGAKSRSKTAPQE